jgi:hypothetical protein
MKSTPKSDILYIRIKRHFEKRYKNMLSVFFGKCKDFLRESVDKLPGKDKRVILGKIAIEYGHGGQSMVAREFNTGRNTIRKGAEEYTTGVQIKDRFSSRGRATTESKLPNLTADIKAVVESTCQTDPKFKSTRLYTRLTVTKIRKLLIEQRGYDPNQLPKSDTTLNRIVNDCGYLLKRVMKVKPIKKIPETNKIFDNLSKVHAENKDKSNVVRLSIDAKDKVKIGEFSRNGKTRVETKANDHDFGDRSMTPFGILNVDTDKVSISMAESKITADFIVDRLEEYWEKENLNESKDTLLLNSDNGPECSSRRTQFIKRMVEFSARANISIIMAYYPPYHSKYNPIERVWGVLERHWNGDLLDTEEAVLGFASTMTWKGNHPDVSLVTQVYDTGIKLDNKTMKIYSQALDRAKKIGKWFLKITPKKAKKVLKIIAQT